ncbi:DUF488 domain-containing protein [Ktedonobacter racemifer]|uniref:DUF488 domain-containing protein n=1 Tax=Ktedonobacter racemifer DSM 44963 TaxID=485913 RepID=D6TIU0_KTERA|nr:DUF488 domain-containing protein [Ktedonobacter racemifer]EFH89347.1 hypothetical protein Krac_10897 [Ktedonobacter racemifer DSM 44963]
MSGRVYLLGYAAPGAAGQLEQWMADTSVVLVDIRLAARSRWMREWNKGWLVKRWGDRYVHESRLGNVNYQDRRQPIAICDLPGGLAVVTDLLSQDRSVVLLCACADESLCHRRVVAEALASLET